MASLNRPIAKALWAQVTAKPETINKKVLYKG